MKKAKVENGKLVDSKTSEDIGAPESAVKCVLASDATSIEYSKALRVLTIETKDYSAYDARTGESLAIGKVMLSGERTKAGENGDPEVEHLWEGAAFLIPTMRVKCAFGKTVSASLGVSLEAMSKENDGSYERTGVEPDPKSLSDFKHYSEGQLETIEISDPTPEKVSFMCAAIKEVAIDGIRKECHEAFEAKGERMVIGENAFAEKGAGFPKGGAAELHALLSEEGIAHDFLPSESDPTKLAVSRIEGSSLKIEEADIAGKHVLKATLVRNPDEGADEKEYFLFETPKEAIDGVKEDIKTEAEDKADRSEREDKAREDIYKKDDGDDSDVDGK
jgi:hypothetical protein